MSNFVQLSGQGSGYSDYSSYNYYQPRKSKIDWSGVSIGDAFKYNLDYYARLPAQRLFYHTVRSVQKFVIQLTGLSEGSAAVPRLKPQLSPFYSSYPASLAGYAAVGLTGFLEYLYHSNEKILLTYLKDYLVDPAQADALDVDPDLYNRLVAQIAQIVQTRLVLEDLKRHKPLSAIETYRIFSASQQNLIFQTVTEILNAIILYGDLLPSWRDLEVHPATRHMMDKIETVCRRYFKKLNKTQSKDLLELGGQWTKDLSRAMAIFLDSLDEPNNGIKPPDGNPKGFGQLRYRKNEPQKKSDRIPPLNKPQIPSLFKPKSPVERLAERLLGLSENNTCPPGSELRKPMQEMISRFSEILNRASGQNFNWEDIRSDMVEQDSRINPFTQGPLQGNPTDGQQVDLTIGDKSYQSEIFDRPVELADDSAKVESLIQEAAPITRAMRRTLYPNIEKIPTMNRLRTSGSLDPARLAMVNFANAVFKRYCMREKADKRGRPVLVIACDGSGSLNSAQVKMLKLLTTAWLQSTLGSSVQILAGLYHSGEVRSGMTGTLVQWIYHPKKTPSIGHNDTVRALVSLPDAGTGVQADAPSIAFILQEAQKISRGRMIYLILLTDCAWNRSFHTELTGLQEVQGLFKNLREDMGDQLHTTLVALGKDTQTELENQVDKVIRISSHQLKKPMEVAEQIGVYVASCMKERSKIISRSH
jgi:hypothetical protein